MGFSIGDIAGDRAEAFDPVLGLALKCLATDNAGVGKTSLANTLCARGWLGDGRAASNTYPRWQSWIWQSLGVKLLRVLCPIGIVGPGMARLTERYKIRWVIGDLVASKNTVRNLVVAIKRFACSDKSAILAGERIPFKNRKRDSGPFLSTIWSCTHGVTIAQSGE